MPTPETCTLAEFARRRGVSRKTTTTWKQRGWLVMTDDGQVDVAGSTNLLNQRPAVYRGGHTNRDSTNGGAEMEAAREQLRHDDSAMTHAEALRVKEVYLAKLRKLEFETESGRLVPCDQVEKAWGQLIANARKHLLAIPTKLAERILLAKTPADAERILRDEIYAALTELSQTQFVADGGGKTNGADDADQ